MIGPFVVVDVSQLNWYPPDTTRKLLPPVAPDAGLYSIFLVPTAEATQPPAGAGPLNALSIFSSVVRELMALPSASFSVQLIGTALPWLAELFNAAAVKA